MPERFLKQDNPFIVPTEDNKVIAEHFGRASTGTESLSIARMAAPPGDVASTVDPCEPPRYF